MIDNINTNQMQPIFQKPPLQQPDPAKTPPSDGAEVSIQVSFDSLIDKALETPQADPDAVQKARRLLLSGQLDSPQNIRSAAQNIAEFGV